MSTPVPSATALGATLFGHTRSALLGLLFGNPSESYYLRDIVRRIHGGLGAVQRELAHLVEAGVLDRFIVGRHVFYRARRDCPILPELCVIAVKTSRMGHVIRESLDRLGERIRMICIFGSAARGEQGKSSDVDVLVVGDVTFREVVSALSSAQERLGREINPVVYSPSEFARRLREADHFLLTVAQQPKVVLLGSESEFDGLAQEWLARAASNKPAGDRRSAGRRRSRSH